jgi:hypothetical protein
MAAVNVHRESRQYPRYDIDLNVALYLDDLGIVCGQTINVSEGGLSVDTGSAMLTIGDKIEVAISLPRSTVGGQCIRTQGTVLYAKGNTAGIVFTTLQADIFYEMENAGSHLLH